MAYDVNKMTMTGRLDAEPKITERDGTIKAEFRLITRGRTRDAEPEESTWITWDNLARVVQSYLHTGSRALCEGYSHTVSWVDKISGEARSRHVFVATDCILLDPRDPAPARSAVEADDDPGW